MSRTNPGEKREEEEEGAEIGVGAGKDEERRTNRFL